MQKEIMARSNILKEKKWRNFKDNFGSLMFVMPVILGILFFTLIPMITSLYYSLTDYNTRAAGEVLNFIGMGNFITAFTTEWKAVGNSLWITFSFTAVSLPLTMFLSYILAMFLNQNTKGIKFFRTLYYVPVIIPAVVGGLLWTDMTQYEGGILNYILVDLWHLPPYGFYTFPETVLPTLLFMGLFGLGGGMVLWLAQLKSIPEAMYEAAQIEGAGFFVKTFKITIPMCTPMIFYNLIMGIIGGLQVFSSVYLLRTPANSDSLNFFVIMIYDNAMGAGNMGFACALSWILFLIIAVITAVTFKYSKWVFYGEAS